LALEESCISVNGVAYPMNHRIITLKDIFSISNEITSEECSVDIHYGRVLMMETRD
jgi:thiamine pyrophosphokinase